MISLIENAKQDIKEIGFLAWIGTGLFTALLILPSSFLGQYLLQKNFLNNTILSFVGAILICFTPMTMFLYFKGWLPSKNELPKIAMYATFLISLGIFLSVTTVYLFKTHIIG